MYFSDQFIPSLNPSSQSLNLPYLCLLNTNNYYKLFGKQESGCQFSRNISNRPKMQSVDTIKKYFVLSKFTSWTLG